MGIHGLTTFLRENKRTLSRPLTFYAGSPEGKDVPLIVDGWSFIYKVLQDSNLPWVFGGEYEQLSQLVSEVVQAWIDVGFRPIFVFDGPTPVEKFQTVTGRLNQAHVQPALLYFRTSSVSRNTRRFLKETQIIPPLAYSVCVQAILSFRDRSAPENGHGEGYDSVALDRLEVHFADEEGDPYAVELAGRLEGYVTGRDSDFVVLNSEGYKGYLPLDELVWLAENDKELSEEEDTDGFQQVKAKKNKASDLTAGQGIIPPASGTLVLSTMLYTPAALAQILNTPLSLLPLVGALVGNDYTLQGTLLPQPNALTTSPKAFHNLLFERRLSLSQRILRVGEVLSAIVRPLNGKMKKKLPKTVMELIEATIGTLVATSNAPAVLVGPDQVKAIIESVVEGTLPYAMPMRPADDVLLEPTICSLHHPDECRLLAILDRMDTDLPPHAVDIANIYLRAYRLGKFSPALMNVLSSRTFWPKIFLENPDSESVSRSISRPLRLLIYAILDDGIGIPVPDNEDEAEEGANGDLLAGDGAAADEDLDELVDVKEDYSDESDSEYDVSADVGRLRGALRDLRYDKTPNNELDLASVSEVDTSSIHDSSVHQSSIKTPSPLPQKILERRLLASRQKYVVEHVRKGARVTTEDIAVVSLQKLLPAQEDSDGGDEIVHLDTPLPLQPVGFRLKALLSYFRVDESMLQSAEAEFLMPILTMNHVVRQTHDRAVNAGGSKERELERWTVREARAFLASLHTGSEADNETIIVDGPGETTERAIQLTAQILTTLETVELLTQVLLITDVVPSCTRQFSGSRFHALLASNDASAIATIDQTLWEIATQSLDGCFAEERMNKKARKKAQKAKIVAPAMAGGKMSRSTSGGLFSLLADAPA